MRKVTHIIAEFWCDPKSISSSNDVKKTINAVVRESKLTKIRSYYHQFSPYGVTGIVLLRESHISIHTWPEYGYAAVDIFGCGEREKIIKAFHLLVEKMKPKKIKKREMRRGI